MVRHNIKVMAAITALSIFVFFAFGVDSRLGAAVSVAVFGLYVVAREARSMTDKVRQERAEQNERDKKAHDEFMKLIALDKVEKERRLKFTENLSNG